MSEFRISVRVYYEDTDAGGVVYYANYLKFMERARTEWVRSLGFELDEMHREDGVLLVVSEAQVKYYTPARFNELLEVGMRVVKKGRASLDVAQAVYSGERVCVSGMIRIACVNNEMRPAALPSGFADKIIVDA